jgi:hypothetical protein
MSKKFLALVRSIDREAAPAGPGQLESLLRNKAALFTRGRARDQYPGNDHDREKSQYAGFAGEICGERRILSHRRTCQHPQDRVEGAVRNHHWPEAP